MKSEEMTIQKELKELREYCGNELSRSDFRTATEMREELEHLKYMLAKVTKERDDLINILKERK